MPARRKQFLSYVIAIVVFVSHPPPIFSASTLEFSNLPASINSSDEVEVDVTFAGDPSYYKDKTYYLRGVFFQTDSKYCSLTQNNQGEWISSATDPTKLFAFTTSQEASWSGKLKVKFDSENSNCGSTGEYQFKIGRYTTTATWSQSKTLTIIIPTPIPTPLASPNPEPVEGEGGTPTPKPTAMPTGTPSNSSSSLTPPSETPIGKVAGASTTKKSKSASFPAELQLSLDSATGSASSSSIILSSLESSNSAKSRSAGDSRPSWPAYTIYGGLGITVFAVAWVIVRSYNRDLLWPWLKLPFS